MFCHCAVAEVKTDGSVGAQVDIQAPDKTYEIPSALGHTSGNNLFHSFDQFNVESGYTANFSGPANIHNIISRVTGSGASHIDGTLQSSIQGANLSLLNPNGVLFGADAKLSISGSFYASSADYLKFGDNDYLYADTTKQSSFVSAEPSAFGFLSNAPGGISATSSNLSVAEGKTLSLIGGDITLDGAQLNAVNGTINIASVASQGEVATYATPIVTPKNPDQFVTLGDISATNATNIDTSGSSGGRIVIRGGSLTLDASNIAANTTGDQNTNTAEGIDIALTKSLTAENDAHISTNVVDTASANASDITISAGNAILDDNSSIESTTQKPTSGGSGNIALNIEGDLSLSNQSRISTQTTGTGDSGAISVSSKSLAMKTASYISTSAVTKASPFSYNWSSAGDIHINSENIDIIGLTETRYSADDQNLDFTGISADSGLFGGNSGNISIETNGLNMVNSAHIRSIINSDGKGGDISISTHGGDLTLMNGAGISTATGDIFGRGKSQCGNITINAGDVSLSGINLNDLNHSAIVTKANGGSDGGDVSISARSISVKNGAFIAAQDLFRSKLKKKSGSVSLSADQIIISGVNRENAAMLVATQGYSEDLAIEASRSEVWVSNGTNNFAAEGYIPSNITIDTKDIYVTDQAWIAIDNFGQPSPGDISINATGNAVFDNSILSTNSEYGIGVGGNINIHSDIAVFNHSTLQTSAVKGKGGNIKISASTILATIDSVFDASSQLSVDGNISFSSTLDIEKSVVAMPNSVEDVTKKFTNDCGPRSTRYSRLKTASAYSKINTANTLESSNYAFTKDALTNGTHDSVASSQFDNRQRTFSMSNTYEPDSLLSSIPPAQIDCSQI